MLSERVSSISESKTLAIAAKAKAMKKNGIDILNFSAGEPDFDTPDNIKEAAKKAMEKGLTKYTAPSGILELRQAISEKFKHDNNLIYTADEIIVSNGAKHSLFNAMLALLSKGDEVIIPVPYWLSYAEQVKLADAVHVFAETDRFRITAEKIKEKITDKTKLIIINSPNNPTGFVFEEKELRKIAELAVENNIYVLSDEVYEKIIYEGKHYSIAAFGDGIKKLTITLNGVSKTYSMTGWRIGYAAGPKEIIKAMSNIQSHTTSNPNSIAQFAALEALKGNQKFIGKARTEFKKRRDYIFKRLSEMKNVSCCMPKGAFYVFPDFSAIEKDSIKLCTDLLEKANIAMVPGIVFGKESFIRISYATTMENIKNGMDRLEKYIRSLK